MKCGRRFFLYCFPKCVINCQLSDDKMLTRAGKLQKKVFESHWSVSSIGTCLPLNAIGKSKFKSNIVFILFFTIKFDTYLINL